MSELSVENRYFNERHLALSSRIFEEIRLINFFTFFNFQNCRRTI
jgi:hypothetical protein